jgi:hypothetical protein
MKNINKLFILACKKKDKKSIKYYAEKLIKNGENENTLRAYYDFTFVKLDIFYN